MNWEWRVFFKDLNINPWKSLINGKKNPIEKKFKIIKATNQSDCYINLGISEAGLKIRGIKSNKPEKKSPKLELKVLQDKIGDIECWKKYISKPITNAIDNCSNLQIDKILELTIQDIQDINLEKIKSQMVINVIKSIINLSIDNITDKFLIKKERKQIRALHDKKTGNWLLDTKFIRNPEVIIIEETKGIVHLIRKEEKSVDFKTYSVESESFKLTQRFKNKFLQIKNEDVMIYSYPEYILSLLE